ncbi:hypothetical protein PoB_001165300 [Plakobranchus ocellatus]|uniref:Uncharacterized protein n=1 Tax=Plakobranchus ocellatus TaxID=259542 RepID=A0AAV3YSA0_9GAST|nr:hypothetical protein PoB_001165300 [Plakobranchus ocellatus]
MIKGFVADWVGCVYDSVSKSILVSPDDFRVYPPTRSYLGNRSFTIRTSDRPLSGYIRLGNKAVLTKMPIVSSIMLNTYVVLQTKMDRFLTG